MVSTVMERPHVLIVDDDDDIRYALRELMLSVGPDATCFASTQGLLDADLHERPGCLVLDVRMPGSSGLDLQHHLASSGNVKPIIFLTAHGDIPMSVQAMKAGAVDFLALSGSSLARRGHDWHREGYCPTGGHADLEQSRQPVRHTDSAQTTGIAGGGAWARQQADRFCSGHQ
jgi:CheY-like chemotaxis protein